MMSDAGWADFDFPVDYMQVGVYSDLQVLKDQLSDYSKDFEFYSNLAEQITQRKPELSKRLGRVQDRANKIEAGLMHSRKQAA